MARKTKDSELNEIKTQKKSIVKKSTSSVSKNKKQKKETKIETKRVGRPKKQKEVVENKESSAKKSLKKDVSVKKSTSNTSATKKTTKKKAKKGTKVKSFKSEYYDLPYYYNKTVVKILAQTPKMLFIYWEISDSDRNNLKKQYGDNFFENTMPVLIVFNDTKHYSFEVAINDFANSWYLHIDDADCQYHIELGRRPVPYNNQIQNSSIESNNNEYIPYYIYLTSSNEMVTPNNKILFNPSLKTIRFKNVKNGHVTERNIKDFTFITNFGIFSLQDLYKFIYPNENFEFDNIYIGSLSSGGNSSGMFSSQFK